MATRKEVTRTQWKSRNNKTKMLSSDEDSEKASTQSYQPRKRYHPRQRRTFETNRQNTKAGTQQQRKESSS